MKKIIFLLLLVMCPVLQAVNLQAIKNKNSVHQQAIDSKKIFLKSASTVLNYGSPPFDNSSYFYSAIKTAPSGVFYRQAGLSPDGQKIVAQKSYTDGGSVNRTEVVLMYPDGSGETIISPGDSNPDALPSGSDVAQYGNPFWSKDGTAIGYVESHLTNPNKVVRYILSSASTSYIYEPVAPADVNNADFLGSSSTSIIFWAPDSGGFADLFIWDGSVLTNITNTTTDKEYEPVSNAAGDKIVYWSGETTGEPVNTTHTLSLVGGVWIKDSGFTPIVDSYWPYWSSRTDNYIGVTVMSSKDVMIYDNTGTLITDLTGAGYSGGSNQRNFFGTGFEGPNGEMILTSNAGQSDPAAARDIIMAVPVPAAQASNVIFSSVDAVSFNVTWTNGSGSYRAAFIKAASSGIVDPVNGTAYTANTVYGFGSVTPGGWYCIYNGSGAAPTITVTGLTPGAAYRVMVCEYNGNPALASTLAYAVGTAVNNPQNQSAASAVPSLISPANAATGISVLPVFTWNDIFDETTFTVRISTNGSSQSAFDSNVIVTKVTAQNATSYTSAIADDPDLPLNNGTTYYWQVSVQGGFSDGAKSAIYHFTTLTSTIAYLSNPSNGSAVYYPQYTIFSWYTGTLTSSLTFILQYKYSATPPSDESFWSSGITEVQTTNTYYSAALQEGRTYYWRVLIRRTTPSTAPYDYVYYPAYSVCNTFNTAGGASVTITQSYPVSGASVYNNTPAVYWYLSQYSTSLTFQVAYQTTAPAGGDTNLFDNSGTVSILPTSSTYTSNMYYLLPTLPSGTTIYWQVLAYYALTGQTVLSNIETFVTPSDPTVTPAQPYLAYPVSGVTVYATNPALYWYIAQAAGSGLRYQIAVKDNVAPVDGDLFDEATVLIPASGNYSDCVTDMFYTLTGLTPGHTYYWQVRSRYSAGSWSTNSAIESFVVASGTSSYPVASWPIGNPKVYTNRPSLYWYLQGTSIGITGYTVKWKKASTAPGTADWAAITTPTNTEDSGSQSVSPASTTYYTITTDLTYGGHYYWYVDSGNPSSASTGEFTVTGGTTSSPVLYLPADGSTLYSTSVTFAWFVSGSSIGIQGYELVYSQSDVFNPSVTVYYDGGSGSGHYPRLTTQTVTISGLTAGATYYWKVRAWYGGTTFSDWVNSTAPFWSFNIQAGSLLIAQPLVGGPTNVTVNTLSPMLSWVIPTKTAANQTYEVQLAENVNFINAKSFSSGKAYCSVNVANNNKNYYWRVRSKAADGTYSYFSNMGIFKVGDKATSVENAEIIPADYSLAQNYPNPFNPVTCINFALPYNSQVSLKVYDMLGREVKTLLNREMNAGNHSTYWNGDNNLGGRAASGMYIYRLTAGSFNATKKMVLIK